ncbi:MAG: CRTAC1 family protein [Isosphaeraceae bacterium]
MALQAQRTGHLIAMGLLALAAGCGRVNPTLVEPGPVSATRATETSANLEIFTDVSRAAGIPDDPEPWPDGTYRLVEMTRGGVALLDYDNDGDLDVLEVRSAPPGRPDEGRTPRLFQRRSDGAFVDVSAQAGLDEPLDGQGVAVGDVDDDGDLDVYLTTFGANVFYRNEGNGRFVNATASAGFSGERFSVSAAFTDYDADGDLDLFVAHYVEFDPTVRCLTRGTVEEYCGPQMFQPTLDTLYRNDGKGRFTDVSAEAGIDKPGRGLGVACMDFTGDGLVDILVANDGEMNHLWVNQGQGRFQDEAIARGVAVNGAGVAEANMGVAVGDVDVDGLLDLFVTHMQGETNMLCVALPGGLFVDRSVSSGLSGTDLPYTGFGCVFLDYDNDGDLDLAIANGRVRAGPVADGADRGAFWNRYAEPNQLYENQGDGRFVEVFARSGSFGRRADVSRGLAVGDLDGDGDLDLVEGLVDGPPRIHRNDLATGNHWLSVRAMTSNRDAIGAVASLSLEGRTLIRPILPGGSYVSGHDPRAHFGLGRTARVDAVDVRWPDGRTERFPVDRIDRQLTVRQGEGSR